MTDAADPPAPSLDEITVRTERLLLRPVRVEDADALFAHASDVDLPRQMTWAAHTSVEETRGFVTACVAAREAGRDVVWVIEEGGRVAGLVGVEGIVRAALAARFDRAEIGYWLGREFRGRGLMTEAARAALQLAFGPLALHKVTVHAFADNHASLRVIEKLGFTRVGRKREDVRKDGVWHDQIAFEILNRTPDDAVPDEAVHPKPSLEPRRRVMSIEPITVRQYVLAWNEDVERWELALAFGAEGETGVVARATKGEDKDAFESVCRDYVRRHSVSALRHLPRTFKIQDRAGDVVEEASYDVDGL